MFRLIKFFAGLAGLAAFVWVGANVPLGSQTLFQHLQAIGRTRETRDLLEGTRETAKPVMDSVRDSVRRRLAHDSTESSQVIPDAGAAVRPADNITESDRQHLKKLLAGEPGERAPRAGRTPPR